MNEVNLQVAKNWIAAFNEHNLEKLLALYSDHAVHYSPKLKIRLPKTMGFIRGKNELHDWWKDAFNRLPALQYDLVSLTANNDRVFMEYTRRVVGEEDMPVAEVLEIANGLIVASRVYHG